MPVSRRCPVQTRRQAGAQQEIGYGHDRLVEDVAPVPDASDERRRLSRAGPRRHQRPAGVHADAVVSGEGRSQMSQVLLGVFQQLTATVTMTWSMSSAARRATSTCPAVRGSKEPGNTATMSTLCRLSSSP